MTPEPDAPVEAPAVAPHMLPRPARGWRWLVIGAVASLSVLGLVTTALSPALASRHPLLLLMLEAPIRNMLLASRVAVVPFLLVVTLRRLFGSVLYFMLGRWYGDSAVLWLERRAGRHGAKVRRVERVVRAGAYPLVFVAPTAVVCTVAGAMGLRPAAFVAVSAAGSLTVGAVVYAAGGALEGPIARVLGVFEHHLVGTTVAAALLVGGWAAWHWYPPRNGPTVRD